MNYLPVTLGAVVDEDEGNDVVVATAASETVVLIVVGVSVVVVKRVGGIIVWEGDWDPVVADVWVVGVGTDVTSDVV